MGDTHINNNAMKKIDINECHILLLEIAKEFDRICRKHNIPYYMLGGTMLGAVRHKGFIPWDDDMDFGIPREYYNKFKDACKSELTPRYKFLCEDNSDYAVMGIGKITDTQTEIKEIYSINTSETIGVNIDIFPLDYTNCSKSLFSFNNRMRMAFKLQKLLFVNADDRKGIKKWIAKFIKIILPLNKTTIPNYIGDKFLEIKDSPNNDSVFNVAGAWEMKELIPQKYFGVPVKYQFEDIELYGVTDYDGYLKSLYSDYMLLPPEDKRHIHFDNVYIKE